MRNKQSKRGLTRNQLCAIVPFLACRRTQHNKQDAVKTIYLLVLGSYKTELACTTVCLITYQENGLPTYATLIPYPVYNLVQLNLSKTFYVLRLVAPILTHRGVKHVLRQLVIRVNYWLVCGLQGGRSTLALHLDVCFFGFSNVQSEQ